MLWTRQLSTWTVASWLGWSLSCIWAACWSTASVFCLCIPAACGATWARLLHWPTSPGNLRSQLHFKLRIYLKEDGDPTPVCLSAAPAVWGWSLAHTLRLFIGSSCRQSWMLCCHWLLSWWTKRRWEAMIWWMFEPSCSQIEDVNLFVCVSECVSPQEGDGLCQLAARSSHSPHRERSADY